MALGERNKVMLKRALLTVITSLFLGLMPVSLLSNPASAASSDGAEHTHFESCPDPIPGACFIADSVGNLTINDNVLTTFGVIDFTFTFDNGTCQFAEHQSVKQHEVRRLDEDRTLQVFTFKSVDHIAQSGGGSLPCDIPPTDCTFTNHIVLVNGEYRRSEFEVDCIPV
jgi:hypothetical protein